MPLRLGVWLQPESGVHTTSALKHRHLGKGPTARKRLMTHDIKMWMPASPHVLS